MTPSPCTSLVDRSSGRDTNTDSARNSSTCRLSVYACLDALTASAACKASAHGVWPVLSVHAETAYSFATAIGCLVC